VTAPAGLRPFAPGSERVWTLGDPDAPDVSFNGTDGYGIEWVIADPTGWYASPPVDLGLRNKAGDGAWFGRGAYRARVLEVTGAFRARTRDPDALDAAAERLQDALDPRRDTLLAVTERPAKQLTVRPAAEVSVLPVVGHPRVRTFSFVLTAADPFKYAAGRAGLVTVPLTLRDVSNLPGLTFPATAPFDFGGGPADAGGLVVNAGREPVGSLVRIFGPVPVPTLTNVTTGQVFTLGTELLLGDEAVIDMDLRTVHVNGVSSFRLRDPLTAFWPLVRGVNDVRFTAPTYSEFARAELSFRPRWK
jgi:hypothetical protein